MWKFWHVKLGTRWYSIHLISSYLGPLLGASYKVVIVRAGLEEQFHKSLLLWKR